MPSPERSLGKPCSKCVIDLKPESRKTVQALTSRAHQGPCRKITWNHKTPPSSKQGSLRKIRFVVWYLIPYITPMIVTIFFSIIPEQPQNNTDIVGRGGGYTARGGAEHGSHSLPPSTADLDAAAVGGGVRRCEK